MTRGWSSGSMVEPTCNAGNARNVGLISGSGRSPGRGHGNPVQSSCLENPMDRGAWWATVHGVAKSQTCLSTHTAHTQIHNPLSVSLQKEGNLDTNTQGEGRPCDDRGRLLSNVCASQVPRTAGKHQSLARGKDGFCPRDSRGRVGLLTPPFKLPGSRAVWNTFLLL